MKKNRKRKKPFGRFLITYCSVLFVLAIGTWILLYLFIGDYEEGQSKHIMESYVEDFSKDKYEELVSKVELDVSDFEEKEQIASYLADKIDYTDVTYKKKAGEFSEQNPVYELVAGKKKVAKISLASQDENFFGFPIWGIDKVEVKDYLEGNDKKTYELIVPTGSAVVVNGKNVGDTYVTESGILFEPCKNISAYVETPTLTKYVISDLMIEPEVEVSLNEQALVLEKEETIITASYPEDTALLEEQREAIEALAKNYSLYLINKSSLGVLNASMIGTAQEYVRDIPAIWAFPQGGTASFEDMELWNCLRYSDDCFSVNISYNMKVVWTNGTPEANYDTHLNYTFVKRNGKWYLADFVTQNL